MNGDASETLSRLIVPSEGLMEATIGAAIRVHKELGSGLLESFYRRALMIELRETGLASEAEVPIESSYRGESIGLAFRADIIVERVLLLELKSVSRLDEAHLSQVLTYLRLLGFKRGLLINFNVPYLRDGIRRLSI